MKQEEKNFCLAVAGHSFYIHTLYEETWHLCGKYIVEGPTEKEIYITEEDIEEERKKTNPIDVNLQNDYLETLAVYRKIAEAILEYDTFLMHGAVVAYENSAYMFTATSGTGKTTHIRLWLKNLKDAYVVNGDKPLIRMTGDEAIACGTPWQGKEKLGGNCMVPLKAIVLMERGENNKIEEITFEKALSFLLRQTYMPEDVEKMKKTLALVAKLKDGVKFYKYVFNNMKDDAFEVAYGMIVEENR